MDAVRKARTRMRQYPMLLGKCSVQAGAYAACVTQDFNVSHKACDNEFNLFKECLKKAAADMKTKL